MFKRKSRENHNPSTGLEKVAKFTAIGAVAVAAGMLIVRRIPPHALEMIHDQPDRTNPSQPEESVLNAQHDPASIKENHL